MRQTIPDAALTQHLIALGKTGSGKSSALRVLVERLLDQEKPVAIIDPKGDWWGLKSSADGKRAGYSVVIFGGEHADVPLNVHAGAHVAELVATGNRPCIIDLGGWMVADRTRFFIDFASTLFRHTRGPRWLVIDEVHNFAPQGKVIDPDAGKMLHWANRLASEGRGKGVTLLAASQRPQKVHKDFLTSCETLLAMRVIHPLDRGAIKDWIDGCPDAAKGREVLGSLAQMPRGESWAWSPEIGFGPQRIVFPKFRTYDSFAAPVGEATTKLAGWATVDLEEVRTKLADVVQEAEANDPKRLRAEIGRLKAELTKRPTEQVLAVDHDAARAAGQAGYERGLAVVSLESQAEVSLLANAVLQLRDMQKSIEAVLTAVKRRAARAKDAPKAPPANVHPKRIPVDVQRGNGSGDPSVGRSGLRRMLIALAQRPRGLNRRQLGVRAGISSKSGTFDTYLSKARTNGWIDGRGDLTITPAGLEALGAYEPLPEGRDLLNYWLADLGQSGAARILRSLADAYPKAMTRAELGAAANLSDSSGTFDTYLSKLRTLELVEGRGEIRASEELFG